MNREELVRRIENKQQEIQKIEKQISKLSEKINDDKAFEKHYSWLSEEDFEAEREELKLDWTDDLNCSIKQAYRNLDIAHEQLEKYQKQLEALDTSAKEEKVKVIWDFLQEWRKNAYEFYVNNVKRYSELVKNESQAWEEYKLTDEYTRLTRYLTNHQIKSNWTNKYYDEILTLTTNIVKSRYAGTFDAQKLNDILDNEVQRKYDSFIARITEKAGNIIDASNLKIAGNCEINGIITGDNANVYVETITAGGYNIQRLHYRVLVNVIRG